MQTKVPNLESQSITCIENGKVVTLQTTKILMRLLDFVINVTLYTALPSFRLLKMKGYIV